MKIKTTFRLLFLLGLSLLNSGCATMSFTSLGITEEPEEPALKESPEAAMFRATQTARQSNSIVLQVEGSEKPMRVIPLPQDGTAVFMNDLLRQAGLLKRVATLDVTLFRSDGSVMDGVQMAVTFDKKSKRVSTGTDYALRPGDRVTVRRDSASLIQGFVDGFVPPVARQAAMR